MVLSHTVKLPSHHGMIALLQYAVIPRRGDAAGTGTSELETTVQFTDTRSTKRDKTTIKLLGLFALGPFVLDSYKPQVRCMAVALRVYTESLTSLQCLFTHSTQSP